MSGKAKMSPSRREILVGATTLVAGATLAASPRMAEAAPPAIRPHRFGMAIDLGHCLRCQTCVVACAAENNVPPLGTEAAPHMRPIHWMDMLVPNRSGVPSLLGPAPAPIPCMHCDEPACVRVCPVGATYRADDGVVAQIWDRCIGCRACMVACPYSRRYYDWVAPAWPGGDASSANPDVALRPAGVVEKCTFCQHRIRATFERARIEEESVTDAVLRRLPACAAACPTGAITFGNLADPDSTLSVLASDPRAVRLLEHLGTGPKVFYLRGKP